MFSLAPKTSILTSLSLSALGLLFGVIALGDTHWARVTYDSTDDHYGLWKACSKEKGDSDFNCYDILTDDINSNLNAARAFTIFWFLAALVVVAGSINAWRSAGAHPHPKVTFISALVAAFCTIISMGAYANWFHQQIVSDVQQVGNNPTSSYMGSFVITVLSLFLYAGAALALYLGFGFPGVLGNGVPGSHTQLVEDSSPSAAASKATYQGVAGGAV